MAEKLPVQYYQMSRDYAIENIVAAINRGP
jgi:hypothetical protein